MSEEFQIKDCALISIATGVRAQTLKEFRDALLEVPEACIYHHVWGRLLRPRFDEPEYNNDFAAWVCHALHEKSLAERLSMVTPAEFAGLEELRRELVEIVEQRLDEAEIAPWARPDQQFHFLQARLVIFDTRVRIETPEELADHVLELPTGSVYYHFIDARRRNDSGADDFSTWLVGFGEPYAKVRRHLAELDPYFSSLKEVRHLIAEVLQSARPGGAHV